MRDVDDDAQATLAKTDARVFADVAARHRPLIGEAANKHLRMAERYGVELEDLEAAGQLGLVAAVRSFEPSKGAFSNTLARYIEHEMRQLYPRQDGREGYEPRAPHEALVFGNEPSISRRTVATDQIVKQECSDHEHFNFDTTRFFGQCTDQLAAELVNLCTEPREQEALARALTGESHKSIAKSMGLSRQRVTQLAKLGHMAIAAALPDVLAAPKQTLPGSGLADQLESERAWSFAKYYNPLARWVTDERPREQEQEPEPVLVEVNPDGVGGWTCVVEEMAAEERERASA